MTETMTVQADHSEVRMTKTEAVTTTFTITLAHERALAEAEFKELFRTMAECINGKDEEDSGIHRFKGITETFAVASHYDERNNMLHGPLRCRFTLLGESEAA